MTRITNILTVLLPLLVVSLSTPSASGFISYYPTSSTGLAAAKKSPVTTEDDSASEDDTNALFEEFVDFLKGKQAEIIQLIEEKENDLKSDDGATFSRDAWGIFAAEDKATGSSGGITRVLQGGSIVEKGACSLTVIRDGILTADRASTIRARQSTDQEVSIQAGDRYAAAALSMVLHSSHPMVPTFRSDVRVFLVQAGDDKSKTLAWFGGGADLTPYYLFEEDISYFHKQYRDLCAGHLPGSTFTYASMKKACDDYFYLPARSEHRGTGGIFFDDLPVTAESTSFVEGVASAWMPSWFPIVDKRQTSQYNDQQKQWQLLRRGRYLEFNLLYDRGVKFGLANANPRVEGVMVSAPPMIAYEYNHKIEKGSPEADIMKVLKEPREWV